MRGGQCGRALCVARVDGGSGKRQSLCHGRARAVQTEAGSVCRARRRTDALVEQIACKQHVQLCAAGRNLLPRSIRRQLLEGVSQPAPTFSARSACPPRCGQYDPSGHLSLLFSGYGAVRQYDRVTVRKRSSACPCEDSPYHRSCSLFVAIVCDKRQKITVNAEHSRLMRNGKMKKKSQNYCIRFCVRLYTKRSAKKFFHRPPPCVQVILQDRRAAPRSASDGVCIERAAAACERGVEIKG